MKGNKMKLISGIVLTLCLFSTAMGADVTLSWDASGGATGYKIYQSVDNGVNWNAGEDAGSVLTYTIAGVPDTGLVLFQIGAYNSAVETITTWQGAWYWGDKKPPVAATGLGVK